ncbi:MAG TPA: class I SAM-dependent methyltransferase [Caulobacteraceae bacterium]|jgi:ubiquinone/menaquinone biosynthesis C-methylase UbiE
MSELRAKPAFRAEAARQRATAAVKAAWWTAAGAAARRLARPGEGEDVGFESEAPKPPKHAIREAYLEAFRKEREDVAAGLYPALDGPLPGLQTLDRLLDLLNDARAVDARRRRRGGVEARAEAPSDAYPAYYRQNFHYQSGGWFTADSARRYEAQVEALFAGTAAAMRRRALALLARALRERDQRGLTILDAACGAGAMLGDLRGAFPRARVLGLDLSAAYLEEARRRSGAPAVQGNCERLPFADASLDAVTCVYLFHELPPKVRPVVAAELARVLKPGGVLALADSVQAHDAPQFRRMLEAFPAYFHEPYYDSYQATDVPALFADAGVRLAGSDKAFLTKAWLFQKA